MRRRKKCPKRERFPTADGVGVGGGPEAGNRGRRSGQYRCGSPRFFQIRKKKNPAGKIRRGLKWIGERAKEQKFVGFPQNGSKKGRDNLPTAQNRDLTHTVSHGKIRRLYDGRANPVIVYQLSTR